MEEILNSAVIWFGIGLLFFLLEFLVPGFILFFFGVGAWIVGIVSLFTDVSLNTQILLFVISSGITVLLFRNWVRVRFGGQSKSHYKLDDEYVGKVATAETAIIPGTRGKVEFKGTSWDAQSEDHIMPGEQVVIVNTESILLIVKSINQI